MSDADTDGDGGPALSEEARERLADIVELQPTKNSALKERWGVESGSEVHQYLESELRDYYYRDENSLIRATAAGVALVRGEEIGETIVVHMTDLEERVFAVVAGPEERSESVVSVLEKLREEFDIDPEAKAVRRALNALERKGVVEVVYRAVPTFRLAVERDAVEIDDDDDGGRDDDWDEAEEDDVDGNAADDVDGHRDESDDSVIGQLNEEFGVDPGNQDDDA